MTKDDTFDADMPISDYDYYDYDAMEKLQNRRAEKYMDLVRQWHKAKENNNEKAMKKAMRAMSTHKKQNEKIKAKCDQSGFYWC